MSICILSNRPEAAAHYSSILMESGFDSPHIATSVKEMFELLTKERISGIAMDIPVTVRASDHDKQLLNGIGEVYPTVKINWAPGRELRVMCNQFLSTREKPLESFLQACNSFKPRIWRKDERIYKVVNLSWSVGDAPANRGFTVDVSQSGCFVCTFDPPAINDVVTLHVQHSGQTVTARVTWVVKWGEKTRAPGFGCAYEGGSRTGLL